MDTPTSNQNITKSSNYEFMVGKPSLVAAEQLKWVASTDWRFYRRRAALRQYWRETWGLGNFFGVSKLFKQRNFLENKSNCVLDFFYWFLFSDFHLPEIGGKFTKILINNFRIFLIFSVFLFLWAWKSSSDDWAFTILSWVGSNPPINWSLADLNNFFLLFFQKIWASNK